MTRYLDPAAVQNVLDCSISTSFYNIFNMTSDTRPPPYWLPPNSSWAHMTKYMDPAAVQNVLDCSISTSLGSVNMDILFRKIWGT